MSIGSDLGLPPLPPMREIGEDDVNSDEFELSPR